MAGELQPLEQGQRIVTESGLPTPYFTRWAQQRQIDIGDSITLAQAQQLIDDWAAARDITAGLGLSGGGNLSADLTIDLAASIDDLTDVDTTSTPPQIGFALVWTGTEWAPGFPQSTVAGLPVAGTLGRIAIVTDALAPAYLTAVVGGGAVKTPVFDNGAAWVSF